METTARITKGGKHYEILVDLDEALKVKKGEGNINSAVLTEAVFHNIKSGERAGESDLNKEFGTVNFPEVCLKIIQQGEVVLTSDFMKEEQEKKYKQVVDFLVSNAVDQNSRPYTPDRIMSALKEANVNVKNKPIESQVSEILEALNKIIPIKMEMKKVKIIVPAQHTGQVYGLVNEYKEKEEWKENGDLEVILNVPAGIIFEFYDKLNSSTHGSAITEEIKE
jgi:ribosome maturation protein SDO1